MADPGQRSKAIGYDPGKGEEFWLGAQPNLYMPPEAVPTTTEAQQESLAQLMEFLTGTMGSREPSVGEFTTELPGPSSLQSASLAGLEALARGDSGIFQGGRSGLDAIEGILASGPESYNDFFDVGVAQPAERDLQRALDQISAQSVGSGNLFGSERQGMQRDITEDFFRNMSEERGRYGLQALGKNISDKLAAAGLLPELAGLDVGIGERLYNIGAAEREQGVEQVELNLQEQQRQQEMLIAILDLLMKSAVSPTFGVAGGYSIPASTGGSGFVGGLMESLPL